MRMSIESASMKDKTLVFGFAANSFFLFSIFAVLAPYLSVFLKLKGFSPDQIGLLLGLYDLAAIFGPLLLGPLADARHRYKYMIIALVSLGLLSFAGLNFIYFFPLAALFCFSLGFFIRPVVALTDAFIGSSFSDPGVYYGKVRAFGSIGFVFFLFAVSVSGYMKTPEISRITVLFFIAAALHLSTFLFIPVVDGIKNTIKFKDLLRTAFGKENIARIPRDVWYLLVLIFISRISMAGHFGFFSLYAYEKAPGLDLNFAWALGAVTEIPVIFFGAWLIRKTNIRVMLAVSLISLTLRLLIYAVSVDPLVLNLAQLLHSFSFGGLHVTAVYIINQRMPAGSKAFGMALIMSLGYSLGSSIGNILGGFIVQHSGFQTLFLSYSVLPLLALFILRKIVPADNPST